MPLRTAFQKKASNPERLTCDGPAASNLPVDDAEQHDTASSTADEDKLVAMPPASVQDPSQRVRVLLLDDDPATLLLRSAILRHQGYECSTAGTVQEANGMLDGIDVAVLDYHLGHGKFGTEVAARLRQQRPAVPIIILSATLEHRFGGVEDMHLLKGYSSAEDLLGALRSLEAKRRGAPVVVDARDFYYSRIARAIGSDVLVQILRPDGTWEYVNDKAAAYLGKSRDWFPGRNLVREMGDTLRDWSEILHTVASTRETYIDRTRRGLLQQPKTDEKVASWSVLAFPIMLHDGGNGAVLSARVLE